MNPHYTTPPVDRWNSHQQDVKRPRLIWSALFLAILAHVALFLLFKNISFQKNISAFESLETEPVFIDQVVIEREEVFPVSNPVTLPDETEPEDLVPELEALAKLKNQDIEIKPSIIEPELSVKKAIPLAMGDLESSSEEILNKEVSLSTFENIGEKPLEVPLVDEGNTVIEGSIFDQALTPSSSIFDKNSLKGAEGSAIEGVLEGYSSVDDLLSMSDTNLSGAKAALPSDLLYNYDSAKLKESAKYGLMKLALLIHRNPKMFCLLEGHSDTFGEDNYNLELSEARAQAVRDYLVETLKQNADQIVVRGYGSFNPLIETGSVEEQSINRRVDILMRDSAEDFSQTLPPAEDFPETTDPAEDFPQPSALAEDFSQTTDSAEDFPQTLDPAEEQAPVPILVKPSKNPIYEN